MNIAMHPNHLNVVLIYESVSSAKRAKEFCDRFETQLAPGCELYLSLWSLSSLHEPAMAEAAAREAEHAALIIVAVHGDNTLPPMIEDGLDSCVREIRVGNGVLLAQLHGILKTDEKDCPAYDCLRAIAYQRGLRFFSQVVELPDDEQSPLGIRDQSWVSQGLYAEVND